MASIRFYSVNCRWHSVSTITVKISWNDLNLAVILMKPFIIPTPYWLTFYYSYPLLAHQATDENV